MIHMGTTCYVCHKVLRGENSNRQRGSNDQYSNDIRMCTMFIYSFLNLHNIWLIVSLGNTLF